MVGVATFDYCIRIRSLRMLQKGNVMSESAKNYLQTREKERITQNRSTTSNLISHRPNSCV